MALVAVKWQGFPHSVRVLPGTLALLGYLLEFLSFCGQVRFGTLLAFVTVAQKVQFIKPVLEEDLPYADEDEGQRFKLDEVPEAEQAPPTPPIPDYGEQSAPRDALPAEGLTEHQTLEAVVLDSPLPAGGATTSGANAALAERRAPGEDAAPPPPAPGHAPGAMSQGKTSPYSVIDIAPVQQRQPSSCSPEMGGDIPEEPSIPRIPPGYSVPPPCGYAVPSNVPVITPTYTAPVIIRHFSMDEDGPDEVIYDDVPRENSDSTTDPEEMIYDDVELGEDGSSLDNGWSSSEFESYDEQSDAEGRGENGLPDAFMRSRPHRSKTHVRTTLGVCLRISLFGNVRDGVLPRLRPET
ncbi:hypothetical protein Z043_101239 [Scleropages formosus]|uniref:Uncharacterized protein n=1 Tax=Scleropages formosus TaxID=113540 RepID=A0A0P7ZDS0_SCLFO|nr:hypothetical protein Z043_101239 [Scleropages formosus]